jgi:hypothetical protein
VLDRLEATVWRIGTTLGVYPSRRITVVLYTRQQYDEITRLAAWSAAAYDGRLRIPLGDTLQQPGELERALSHEFVHALVGMVGGRNVPAWVNEGLASVLEPAGSADVEAILSRSDERPPLSTLHDNFAGLARPDAEIAYAFSARTVRRLIEKHGMAAVVRLLEDLGRGIPFARAFQQRTSVRYEQFAARVARD